MQRKWIAVGVATVVLSGAGLFAVAAESGKNPYAGVLSRVARKDGVRWDLFGPEERQKLKAYLEQVAGTDASSFGTRNEQLAFWINAHNACVMKLILDHWPVEDVMKIQGFRDKLTCRMAGTDRTLVDLDSGLIRPLFAEPRARFALWWGAKGSPTLPGVPYDGTDLDRQLDAQVKTSLESPKFVNFGKDPAVLSPLLDWFKGDFGKTDDEMLRFVRAHVPKDRAKRIPVRVADAKFGLFDWSIDQASK